MHILFMLPFLCCCVLLYRRTKENRWAFFIRKLEEKPNKVDENASSVEDTSDREEEEPTEVHSFKLNRSSQLFAF